jgi:hypothetical protein
MAYDATRARTVVFAGFTFVGNKMSDTWEWDGTSWVERVPLGASPIDRWKPAMAFDAARGRCVVFGGSAGGFNTPLSDTWEYGPVHAAVYTPFGTGCAGSAGTPNLAAAAGQRPWLGESLTLECSQLPANAFAVLMLGSSRTSWGGIPLPIPLDFLGMAGCSLHVSGEFFFAVAASGGLARSTRSIPSDRSLLGGSLYYQALVSDPPANAFGATMSNAGQSTIGGK